MLAVEVLAERHRISVVVSKSRTQRQLRIEVLLDRSALKNLRQLVVRIRPFGLIGVARYLGSRTDRQHHPQHQGGAGELS